jgi:hypothetical protein
MTLHRDIQRDTDRVPQQVAQSFQNDTSAIRHMWKEEGKLEEESRGWSCLNASFAAAAFPNSPHSSRWNFKIRSSFFPRGIRSCPRLSYSTDSSSIYAFSPKKAQTEERPATSLCDRSFLHSRGWLTSFERDEVLSRIISQVLHAFPINIDAILSRSVNSRFQGSPPFRPTRGNYATVVQWITSYKDVSALQVWQGSV